MLKLDKALVAESMAIAIIGVLSGMLFVRSGAVEWLQGFGHDHGYGQIELLAGSLFAVAMSLPIMVVRWNGRLRRAVSALRVSEAAVFAAARRDSMTGLPNLLSLYDALNRVRDEEGSQRPHLLLIDLNRFKSINDLRGHAAGDAILLDVAERLRAAVELKDQVYRTGGDEFAIIWHGENLAEFANTLVSVVAQPYHVDDWSEALSGSVGIAEIEPCADASDTVHHADQALHHAKSIGGDGWALFDSALGSALRGKALLEAELRDAIQDNAVVPFFQPILKIETGELTGFEVLARWHRGDSGFVPPDVFIPMAEELGLIDRLSDQLLSKCCAAMKSWDPSLTLSFNLSPRQLNQASLSKRIHQILKEHEVNGRRLAIEITETAVFIDLDRARAVISELRGLGIRVSLDDFGIGTSSLAVLSQLPFDTIKIDRSFISNISENPQNAKIVRGVLALARSLELTVTAEGIESIEDLDFLKANKCVLGQGYFFSRPVPEDALPQLIEEVARAAAIANGGMTEMAPRLVDVSIDPESTERRTGSEG